MLRVSAYEVCETGVDLTQAVLDLVTALARPKATALFVLEERAWRLIHADHVVQADLGAPAQLGSREHAILRSGIQVVLKREPTSLIIPAASVDGLKGILLVRPVPELAALPRVHVPTIVSLLARALDERSGLVDMGHADDASEELNPADREELLAHLVGNEWNVARVARLLGVTRMTIYNRMRRLSVPRQRVYKSRGRQPKKQA